jgi:L-lactate utilization protein LutC
MNSATLFKIQYITQAETFWTMSLEKFLGLVCAEDAEKIREAAKAHYHTNPEEYDFTLVTWRQFCKVATPNLGDFTEDTQEVFEQLLEEQGARFYVQVDCP